MPMGTFQLIPSASPALFDALVLIGLHLARIVASCTYGCFSRISERKPWVPVATARLVVSANPESCWGAMVIRPFTSEVTEDCDEARTGGMGQRPLSGQGGCHASTVW